MNCRMSLATAALSACATVILAGCGYRAGFLIPSDVRTVHVRMVENRTFWREAVKLDNLDPNAAPPRPPYPMEVELTEQIKNEIARRTPLRIAPEEEADSILETTITKVDPQVLLRDASDELLAQRVSISVDFVWRSRLTGRKLAEGTHISRPTDFVVARGESFTTAARRSFAYIAERIVERMQEGF